MAYDMNVCYRAQRLRFIERLLLSIQYFSFSLSTLIGVAGVTLKFVSFKAVLLTIKLQNILIRVYCLLNTSR